MGSAQHPGEEGSAFTPLGWPQPWGSAGQPLHPAPAGHCSQTGMPLEAFQAQIMVVALAGDLSEIPKVTGHGDALR